MTTVWTIGHSTHTFQKFLALLRKYDIQIVIDVRRKPYSHYVPQANRETLKRNLEGEGIGYQWQGAYLGGGFGGRADYEELRSKPGFAPAIAKVLALAQTQRVALMCSEGKHTRCHRHELLAPAIIEQGARVIHIQPDGSYVVETEIAPEQLTLL